MKLRTLFLASSLALGMSIPASALPTTAVTTVAYGNSNINPPSPINDSESLSSNSGAPLTSSSSIIGSNALWSLSADSRADVQQGRIQLYGSTTAAATYVSPPAISYVSASTRTNSNAGWYDTFTIDGGALNGTVGRLVAGFLVDGTMTSGYDGSVNRLAGASLDQQYRASLRLTNAGTGQDVFERGGQRHLVDFQGDRWLPTDFPVRAPGLWTIAIDFEFGTPIQVEMWGDIVSSANAFACKSSISGCSEVSNLFSLVDFGHTIDWAGFSSLTDASGSVVNDYSVSSESGFDYRFGAAVPEPSTLLLLLAGLGMLGGGVRSRV